MYRRRWKHALEACAGGMCSNNALKAGAETCAQALRWTHALGAWVRFFLRQHDGLSAKAQSAGLVRLNLELMATTTWITSAEHRVQSDPTQRLSEQPEMEYDWSLHNNLMEWDRHVLSQSHGTTEPLQPPNFSN